MSSTIEFINNLSAFERRILLDQLLRQKASEPKRFPASFAQERLWFLDQLQPGNFFYNIPAVVPLHIPLHLGALEWSLNEIVRRHEVLRTTFAMVDGQPVQVIAPDSMIGETAAVTISGVGPNSLFGVLADGRTRAEPALAGAEI